MQSATDVSQAPGSNMSCSNNQQPAALTWTFTVDELERGLSCNVDM